MALVLLMAMSVLVDLHPPPSWPLLRVGGTAGPGRAACYWPTCERVQLRGGSDQGMEDVMDVLPPTVRGLVDQLDQKRDSEFGDDGDADDDDDLQRGKQFPNNVLTTN